MANYFVVESENGLFFYKDEEHTLLHREDGPATIWKSGTKGWYVDGKCHREDGPAIIHSDGYQEWWLNGKLHREDGPAIIYANGEQAWYINGEELNEEEFNRRKCIPDEVVINGVTYKRA